MGAPTHRLSTAIAATPIPGPLPATSPTFLLGPAGACTRSPHTSNCTQAPVIETLAYLLGDVATTSQPTPQADLLGSTGPAPGTISRTPMLPNRRLPRPPDGIPPTARPKPVRSACSSSLSTHLVFSNLIAKTLILLGLHRLHTNSYTTPCLDSLLAGISLSSDSRSGFSGTISHRPTYVRVGNHL